MLQSLEVLRKPGYGLGAALIALGFGVTFLYFDAFLFFTPRLILYLPQEQSQTYVLDLAISILSGSVISLSVYQLRNLSQAINKSTKVGYAGIFAALIAGACPCYYLVPLLAVAGGIGGALGAVGILLNTYQFPIKLASLALLAFVSITTERGLRASCAVDIVSGPEPTATP